MTTIDARRGTFDMGRVVSTTFGAIGRNLGVFLVLGMVFIGIPVFVLGWLQVALNPVFSPNGTPFRAGVFGAFSGVNLAIGLAKWILSALLQAAVVHGVIADLNGQKPSVGDCMTTGVRNMLPVAAIGLLFGLGVGLGFLLLIVPGLMLLTIWIVSVPAAVVERTGVFGAFSRSSALTRGNRWPIFGLLITFWILAMIIDFTVLGIFGGLPFSNPNFAMAVTRLPILLATSAIGLMTNVIGTAGVAAIYYELRSTKEGAAPAALSAIFD